MVSAEGACGDEGGVRPVTLMKCLLEEMELPVRCSVMDIVGMRVPRGAMVSEESEATRLRWRRAEETLSRTRRDAGLPESSWVLRLLVKAEIVSWLRKAVKMLCWNVSHPQSQGAAGPSSDVREGDRESQERSLLR